MQELELKPTNLVLPNSLPLSVSQRVSKGFATQLSFILFEFLAEEHPFSHESVKQRFIDSVQNDHTEALDHALYGYLGEVTKKDIIEEESITNSLGKNSSSSLELSSISLPEGFRKRLKVDVGSSLDNFSFLAKIHESHLLKTSIPKFLRELLEISKSEKDFSLSKAYSIAKKYAKDPEIALKSNNISAFVSILYLPTKIRFIVQDIISVATNNKILDDLKSTYKFDVAQEFLNLLTSYNELNPFLSNHWTKLFERYGIDEEVEVALINESHKRLKVISSLALLLEQEKSLRVILDKYISICHKGILKIESLAKESSCSRWMSTDLGHGLADFIDYNLRELSSYSNSFLPCRDKIQSNSIVFEDDVAQARRYREFVDTYSQFRIQEGSPINPQKINDINLWVADFNVNLFLIDIQNQEDREIGVKLAKIITRKRCAVLRSLTEEEREKTLPTLIVVWSSSRESVQQAKSELKNLIKEQDKEDDLKLVDGLHFWTNAKITLDVRLKSHILFELRSSILNHGGRVLRVLRKQ